MYDERTTEEKSLAGFYWFDMTGAKEIQNNLHWYYIFIIVFLFLFSFFAISSTVVYDGCPKSFDAGIWWPKTRFGRPAAMNCPKGSVGVYYIYYYDNDDDNGHHYHHHLCVDIIKSCTV